MVWIFIFLILIFLLPFGFEFAILYDEGNKGLLLKLWFVLPVLAIDMVPWINKMGINTFTIIKELLEGKRKFKVIKLIVLLLCQSSWQALELDGVVGLDDPADTAILLGRLWAFLTPLIALIQERSPSLQKISANLEPQFAKEGIKISLQGILKFTLGKIFINCILFFFKKKGGASFGRATY